MTYTPQRCAEFLSTSPTRAAAPRRPPSTTGARWWSTGSPPACSGCWSSGRSWCGAVEDRSRSTSASCRRGSRRRSPAACTALPFGWATPVTAAAHRRELTTRLSRTTHGAPEAIISACVVAEMAAWAIEQHPVDAVIAAGLREAEELAQQHALHPATLQALRQATRGGWPTGTAEPTLDAFTTMASVLHVLREVGGLATAMKRAVALGGDTDTTAAIVGGILGCQLEDAESQIPWLPRVGLPNAGLIEATAAGLYELRQTSHLQGRGGR
jgi:ADP-ribosyl-[dinitrogen reductase] hydrolase